MDSSTADSADERPDVALVPRLKRHLHAEIVGTDRVWLFSEDERRELESPLLAMLVPLIDGRNTAQDIADRLVGRARAADVLYGLWQLEDAGYLSFTSGQAGNDGRVAFAELLGVPAADAESRLRSRSVNVTEFGSISSGAILLECLRSLGLRVEDSPDLIIVLVDDYLAPELADFNIQALASGRSWLLVKPVGAVLWCGPVFGPGATACWACLARRLRERDFWSAVNGGAKRPRLSCAALESTVRLGIEMAATEAWKWVVAAPGSALTEKLVTFDTRSLTSEIHTVVRQPTCPACGSEQSPMWSPPQLRSRRKLSVSDGGYRCESPDVTYDRYKHHISPITGIADRVERKTAGALDLVQIFTAPYRFASAVDATRLADRGEKRLRSAGKGITASQARTGAFCEAAERYAGIYRGDEIRRTARAVDLGAPWIAPNACMLFSDRQYAEREEWNRRALRFHWVPVPFDPDRSTDWTPAWSLTEERLTYIPTAYCYYGYPLPPDHLFCQADSNGCAAGGNLEEAILQGFMEVVERDAVALWWYNRILRPALNLESFGNAFVLALRDTYLGLNRTLSVYDISSDLGIPVFAAVSFAQNDDTDLLLGFGAHFDATIALARALTELNQFLPAVLADRKRELFAEAAFDVRFLRAAASPSRLQSDFPLTWTADLLDDVERCVSLARGRGLETLVVDLTRPDVELPVVKVLVPGLRPFWARFAPGRLYDVPVAMGWTDKRAAETALNTAFILF